MAEIRKTFENYEPAGEKGFKHFAVVLLLVGGEEADSVPRIVYEVRSPKLDRQPGEICFPGGLIEEGETPLECACRETEEEIGIPAGRIKIIKEIDSVFLTSGSRLHCFLGEIDETVLAEAKLSEAEVAELFTVRVDELMAVEPEMYYSRLPQEPDPDFPYDRVTGGMKYPWRAGRSPVPVYEVRDEENKRKRIIWGLTGRMTKQFLEVLKCSD